MAIIDATGRRSFKIRLVLAGMYLVLAVLGVTMAYPFLITLTASTTNPLDYYRMAPLSRSLWSREERFVRLLVPYFPDGMRGGMDQFAYHFDGVPAAWSTWKAVGDDTQTADTFAGYYLEQWNDLARRRQVLQAAEDYAEFALHYTLNDSLCAYNERDLATYFRSQYYSGVRFQQHHVNVTDIDRKALDLLKSDWGVPISSWYVIKAGREYQTPWDQPNYVPPTDGRALGFAFLRDAYRKGLFLPRGVDPRQAYLTPTRPAPMKLAWIKFLGSKDALAVMGLPDGTVMTAETYNKTFGTQCASLREIPFPITKAMPARLQQLWELFVQRQYPRRLITMQVTTENTRGYQAFISTRLKGDLARANSILGTQYASWDDLPFPATMPKLEAEANLWVEYVGSLPAGEKHTTSAEAAYQQFLQAKYPSIDAVNAAYGWKLTRWEQAEMPVDLAYLATFARNERPLYLASISENYTFVLDYLFRRGRAVSNTALLIALAILLSLTINPLAAYALSRFQMKQGPAIILFMLATMAFPAAVTVIPGFLLMRDLHMLNTILALVLPGVANGMGIFMLKGFFDSLPPELYEAAALDGAPEWLVFTRITLPLVQPILAVTALNSFIAAYNSWEWALVVCQKQSMWTIAVWLYQFNSSWTSQPWAVMASFVIASLPVLLVFMLCQNIILRGIILPQMK